jgi:hypothetical protein
MFGPAMCGLAQELASRRRSLEKKALNGLEAVWRFGEVSNSSEMADLINPGQLYTLDPAP